MDRLRLLAARQGYFTRPDALADGYDDKAIGRALAARLWTRVRQGTYTFTELWADADPLTRHRVTAHAVARRLGPRVALSHTSAAVMHGLALWDADLSQVHVSRLDGGTGRLDAGVVHHEGVVEADDVIRVDDVLVTVPSRAAMESAILQSTEGAVATLDSVLRHHCDKAELAAVRRRLGWWPGARRLEIATRLADGRAESVGESRTRYLCYTAGLPAPELQFEVYDHRGELVARSDFAWPEHGLLGEFDGRVKYGRLLRPGETPQDAVFREKRREDLLREVTQWSMIRFTWGDLDRVTATADRIRRLLNRAA